LGYRSSWSVPPVTPSVGLKMYLCRARSTRATRRSAEHVALRMAVVISLGLVQQAASYLVASGSFLAPRPCVLRPVTFSLQRPAETRTRDGDARSLRCFYADSCGRLLVARSSAARVMGDEFREGIALLVVETTPVGETTALVVNRPTPLLLGHLDLPRFHAFKDCRLFQGGVLDAELGGKTRQRVHPQRRKNLSGSSNLLSKVADDRSSEPHSLSPHHWIHKADGIKGSTSLGAGLYFGALYEKGQIGLVAAP
jgi:hypothetical protein